MDPLKIVDPEPIWLTAPFPEIFPDKLAVLVWLKLMVPAPLPKVMDEAPIAPELSVPPREPTFRVPVELL